jgi:putative DNA primase/helicase
MNGIEDIMTRPDLISRSCSLYTLRIGDNARRDEDELWGKFNVTAPVILGALYDAVSHGLRTENSVRLARKPRMADTAKWLAACLPAFGWEYAAWEQPFADKQHDAEEAVIDGSVVASCLR